jgi:secondary thiamine-phosphate synthase enzyme
MKWNKDSITLSTQGKGLYPFTSEITTLIERWSIKSGMCHLFIPHTSASLVISEIYDPTAKLDMEEFMERYVPENQDWYRHIIEGADDSSSHIRAMLTNTSLSIPIDNSNLNLGRWQGVYLFEHRSRPHHRQVMVRTLSVE